MKETGIDEMDKIAWRDLTMEAADLSLSLSLHKRIEVVLHEAWDLLERAL